MTPNTASRDPRGGGRSGARETAMRGSRPARWRARGGWPGHQHQGPPLVSMGEKEIERANLELGISVDSPVKTPLLHARPGFPSPSFPTIWIAVRQGRLLGGRGHRAWSPKGVAGGPGAPLVYASSSQISAAALMFGQRRSRAWRSATSSHPPATPAHAMSDEIRTGNDGKPIFSCRTMPAAYWAASTSWQPMRSARLRRSADLLHPHAAPLDPRSTGGGRGGGGQGRRKSSPRAAIDPCVGSAPLPVAEAMLACVLADHYLRHAARPGQVDSINGCWKKRPWHLTRDAGWRHSAPSSAARSSHSWLMTGPRENDGRPDRPPPFTARRK